jgi:hypothetical protein
MFRPVCCVDTGVLSPSSWTWSRCLEVFASAIMDGVGSGDGTGCSPVVRSYSLLPIAKTGSA